MGRILSPQKGKGLRKILKKYNVPYDNLKYDSKIITDNPYFRDVKLDSVDFKTVKYEKSTIKKKTLMSMNFHQRVGKYLFHHHPIGYFETDIDLPVLKEGGKVWMSPAISEIESMRDGVKKGHGKCFAMGLGIGFLPYLCIVYEGKSVEVFISSIDSDLKEFAKRINSYFMMRNDVIRTEDELLCIIHEKEVLREILVQ